MAVCTISSNPLCHRSLSACANYARQRSLALAYVHHDSLEAVFRLKKLVRSFNASQNAHLIYFPPKAIIDGIYYFAVNVPVCKVDNERSYAQNYYGLSKGSLIPKKLIRLVSNLSRDCKWSKMFFSIIDFRVVTGQNDYVYCVTFQRLYLRPYFASSTCSK
jgi:hypothetical protein